MATVTSARDQVPDVATLKSGRLAVRPALTTLFERGFSALTSANTQPARFDIMISEHDQAGSKAEETEQ